MFGLYAGFKRDEHGTPLLRPPEGPDVTDRSMYVEYLWHQGVTDPAAQERFWKEERARRREADRKAREPRLPSEHD